MKKLWFKAKLYGYGWYPSTWQGWLITFFYVFLMTISSIILCAFPNSKIVIITYLSVVAILTLLFIFVAYKTGEQARWRWGK